MLIVKIQNTLLISLCVKKVLPFKFSMNETYNHVQSLTFKFEFRLAPFCVMENF